MRVKMIALDIDGTLLDGRTSHIPAANVEAIVAAAALGIEIVLVTGRRFDFTRDVAEQIPCELHLIVSNGAVIKSRNGETHLRHLLPRRIAHEVLVATAAYRSGASVVFDRVEENQVMLEHIDWDDPTRKIYYQRNRRFLGEARPLESCLNEDPIQVGFTGTIATVRETIAVLRAHPLANEFTIALTEYEDRDFSIMDVLQLGITKGVALAEWAQRRGVEREAVMAIGDNWNDMEMLEFAGLPVVMGNGIAELKTLGWPVTLDNDQGGVADAIRRYALTEA
jgi:Cof subfamily protein (haloacid dehalogenase superfamily)